MSHAKPASRPSPRARAYILLETVVSGTIVATAVVGLLGQLSTARISGIASAREQTASRLAAAEIETARAQATTITPGETNRRVVVGPGGYQVRTVVSEEQEDSIPGPGGVILRPRFLSVTTSVSFEIDRRERKSTASTRLYR